MSSFLIGYLVGSIPFALLVSRWMGASDPRHVGSGNLGATNVFRSSGVGPALAVAILDAAKGALSVVLARYVDGAPGAPAAGVAAMVGHAYPFWTGFRGGKAVATACGVFAVLAPAPTSVAVALFGGAVWATGYVSVGSLVAAGALPVVSYLSGSSPVIVAAGVAAAVVILVRHRDNVARLVAGSEHSLRRSDRVQRSPAEDGSASTASSVDSRARGL